MGEEGRQFPVGTSGIGVFRAVAAQYGVLVSAVRGRSRTRAVTDARHMSWYLLRKLFGWSMMEIAAFSDVDHTTVLAGFKRMELLIETEQLASVITRLEAAKAHLLKEEPASKVPFHVAGVTLREAPSRHRDPFAVSRVSCVCCGRVGPNEGVNYTPSELCPLCAWALPEMQSLDADEVSSELARLNKNIASIRETMQAIARRCTHHDKSGKRVVTPGAVCTACNQGVL